MLATEMKSANFKHPPLDNIVILLICREGEAAKKYLEYLYEIGIRADLATNYQDLYRALTQNRYNGIMIDVTTKIRELKEYKEAVNAILERYPFLHLRYDKREKKIFTFFFGQTKGRGNILDFIVLKCIHHDPRKLRVFNHRMNVHLNVWLFKEPDVNIERSQRTITINLSHNGCFLYSIDEWRLNELVWLIFKDLSDQTPICGTIRWFVKWGIAIQAPGIGVEFITIKKTQTDEIAALI